MRVRHAFALLIVLAAACGGNADAGPGADDYFAKLERTSETAHIQEHGLGRDLRVRLEEAALGADRKDAVTVFLDQSARLYQDIVDALRQLNPPPDLAAAQQAYLEAWQGQLELIVKVRDAGFPSSAQVLNAARSTRLPRCGEGDEGPMRGPSGGGGRERLRRGSRLRRSPFLTLA